MMNCAHDMYIRCNALETKRVFVDVRFICGTSARIRRVKIHDTSVSNFVRDFTFNANAKSDI